MRVLMHGRPDLVSRHGGDSTQALKTAQYLVRLGVEVDFEVKGRLEQYDLVHLFNSTGLAHLQASMEQAHAAGKPVALSTIYWNQDELLGARMAFGKGRLLSQLIGPRLATALRKALWYRQPAWQALSALMRSAELLLPNSIAEQELIRRDFPFSENTPVHVVANGVDPDLFDDLSPRPFVERYGVERFILSVGRLEIRKNTLALLDVLRPDDPPCVLIGMPNGLEPDYATRVYELARQKHVLVIDALPHAEIASAYAAALVHALPSWYETPGLATLEAGLAGCPVVTTDRGCTREYFGDLAHYLDPSDPASIRRALDQALLAPRSPDLGQHIRNSFTWSVVAEQTLSAYRSILRSA